MQDLKITATPGRMENTDMASADRHYHIVYLNTDTGVGAMSPAPDGHVHDLVYDPPRDPVQPSPAIPPQIDPMTGQPVMVQDPQTGQMMPDPGQPANPGDPGKEVGSWIVRPAVDASGAMHDHELVDYKNTETTVVQDEQAVIKDCLALWREGIELVADCTKKGRESEEFYKGEQWDDKVERELNGLNRAALTINEIMANIDTLVGYQMDQRTDIRYLPQEDGDQRVADILNVVTKKILDSCYYQREETKVFKDQCIPGIGVFNVYMNFNDNIQGDIHVERFPWDDCVYGPHEKEDLSDCEYEVRSRMVSIAKLKQLFGNKAKEIEESYMSYCGQYPDIEKNDNGVSGTHTDYRNAKKLDDMPQTIGGTIPLVDVQKKQFRLAQVSRKVYKEVTVIFNKDENFFYTAYDWKEKDLALAANIPGFQMITQLKTRMRITKFCGSVVLSDENPADLPLHDFYTVPAYGYRLNGEFWGKVEAAKDPQRELNKRRSQAMDTMNRLGASVYFTEPETFVDKNEKEKFKKNRSKPGAMFEVNDIERRPVLERGADFPAALVEIMQLDQTNLQRLMNIVVEQGGANESGSLFLEKKKSRLTGNQFLFDNLSFAKQKIGKILVALIQRYYPPERLLRILDSQYSKQKFELGNQDYSQFSKEEIVEMLENADLLEYDVIVTESSYSASTRLGIAKMLFDAMGQGAQIDPTLPMKFIDMPADIRAEITDSQQQMAKQQAQAAKDTSNSEIAKTLIAKGQYTIDPAKAQELGLVPVNGQLPSTPQTPNNTDNSSQATEYANNLASALAG